MNESKLKKIVFGFFQPMYLGALTYKEGFLFHVKGIGGFGQKVAPLLFPFGVVSNPHDGVTGYCDSVGGDARSPVVTNQLDRKRPQPSEKGEVIFYSFNGDSHKVLIYLKPNGSLKVIAETDVEIISPSVTIKSPKIELGEDSLEKIVNGETFQTLFNSHKHTGNLGVPTSPPMATDQMKAEHLSQTVKAEI